MTTWGERWIKILLRRSDWLRERATRIRSGLRTPILSPPLSRPHTAVSRPDFQLLVCVVLCFLSLLPASASATVSFRLHSPTTSVSLLLPVVPFIAQFWAFDLVMVPRLRIGSVAAIRVLPQGVGWIVLPRGLDGDTRGSSDLQG